MGMGEEKIGFFGAKKLAERQRDDLAAKGAEITRLNDEVVAKSAEVARLTDELNRLGALEVVELERQRDELRTSIEIQRREADEAAAAQRAAVEAEFRARSSEIIEYIDTLRNQQAQLERSVVKMEDDAELQEIGIYEYRHVLNSSVEYRDQIAQLQSEIKTLAKRDGGAITGTTNWTVNNSAAQGRKMVREFSKLMLRAYNAEADVLVKNMKPHKLASAIDRLNKSRATIERLGQTMAISVTSSYHRLRVRELELTADYINKLAAEKEAERQERERLREERKAQQEMERERQRLEKEQAHYRNALANLEAKGDLEAAARMRAQLADIDRAIEDVDYRAANIRAGYVYVISNVGSFGERMVKVGMTRRLEPMDRIRELSDASVPFNFDVHALFFADDAVGIEQQMHQRLAGKRVNRVNLRREFFYATPAEARDLLAELAGDLLTFEEAPEALEYRQSLASSN